MELLKLKLLRALKREQKLEVKIRDREELEYQEHKLPDLYVELRLQKDHTKKLINQIAGSKLHSKEVLNLIGE